VTPRRAREPGASELGRFLRREGNLKVRRERRQRTLSRALGRIAAIAGTVGLCSLALAGALRWLTTSSAFAVARIEVRGAEHADEAAVRRRAAGALSRNLLLLDLSAVAADVRAEPWVRDVVVRKRLPDALEIEIQEREPCALMLLSGEAFVVDTAGVPVDRFGPRYQAWSFPVLRGLDDLPPVERAARCRTAAGQVRALREAAPDVHAALAEVDLADPRFTVLRLSAAGEVLRTAPDDWLRNLDAWRALRSALSERHGELRYADLRWEGRLAVLPEPQP
jgi:cell division protein FtsQ